MAEQVGIPAKTFDGGISGSRLDNLFYQQLMRYALLGDREVHKITIANTLKDSRCLETMANDAGAPNPIVNAVKNSFARAALRAGSTPSCRCCPTSSPGGRLSCGDLP